MIENELEKMDKERVRKRPRMTWDEAPAEPEVCLPYSSLTFRNFGLCGDKKTKRFCLFFVQAKRAGHGSDGKVLSPPLREDDRDGHYVFSLRENLTPRCEFFFFIDVPFSN